MPLLGLDKFSLNGASGGGSNVKSIQRGEYVITSASVINITIAAVDLTKSIPKITFTGGYGSLATDVWRCTLTTPTNLQITRVGAYAGGKISWSATEFNNVKSLQSGLLVVNSTPQNLVISSVDMNKTEIFVSFSNPKSTISNAYEANIEAILTSSTNIKFESYNPSTNNYTVQWYALEFN